MSRRTTCEFCDSPGIEGQPFSGGKEYYCPSCNEVYSFGEAARSPWAQFDMVAFFEEALRLIEEAAACQFGPCPGPDEPFQDMITCRVCALVQHFRAEREKWRHRYILWRS